MLIYLGNTSTHFYRKYIYKIQIFIKYNNFYYAGKYLIFLNKIYWLFKEKKS